MFAVYTAKIIILQKTDTVKFQTYFNHCHQKVSYDISNNVAHIVLHLELHKIYSIHAIS
jgi:hypothetical protein